MPKTKKKLEETDAEITVLPENAGLVSKMCILNDSGDIIEFSGTIDLKTEQRSLRITARYYEGLCHDMDNGGLFYEIVDHKVKHAYEAISVEIDRYAEEYKTIYDVLVVCISDILKQKLEC